MPEDSARELKPVVMFDDKGRTEEGVRDFRPIAQYVEEQRGKNKISDTPPDPDKPFAHNVPDPGDVDGDQNPPVDASTGDTEEPNAGATTGEDEGSLPPDDDTPSPWDEPISD